MNKLNSGFSRVRDVALVKKTQAIISALQDNIHFLRTNPPLRTVRSSLAAFQSALALSKSSARDRKVKVTRSVLVLQLHQLARNLEMTANVTDAMLAKTGFRLRKRALRSNAPVDAPLHVRLRTTGISGSVQLLCAAVYRAKSYEAQYTRNPNTGPWTDAGTFASTRGIIISGLIRGKDYWVRIRAIGPKGPGAWSDAATIMVT
jgi:hypothetical protein